MFCTVLYCVFVCPLFETTEKCRRRMEGDDSNEGRLADNKGWKHEL
jgi:hypothetical protein